MTHGKRDQKNFIKSNFIEPIGRYLQVFITGFNEVFDILTEGFTSSMTLMEVFKSSIALLGIAYDKSIPAVKFMFELIKMLAREFMFWGRVTITVIDGIVTGFKFLFGVATSIIVKLKTQFSGLKDIIQGAFNLDSSQIKRGADQIASAGKEGAKAYAKVMATDTSVGGLASRLTAEFKELSKPKGVTLKSELQKESKKGGLASMNGGKSKVPTSTASGSDKKASTSIDGVKSGRPTNININITKLVESFNVTAVDLDDMNNKAKDLVAQALLSAVNNVNNIAQ